MNRCIATAPPSVGNMAVGFDLIGHALVADGDQVRATKQAQSGVHMGSVTGVVTSLPIQAEKNTAGAGVIQLLADQNASFGVTLDVHKGIALGSGMGGSASSAVAAVAAVNQLLETPLPNTELLRYALIGEAVASGAAHGDNVAPSLMGGIAFMPPKDPELVISIPVPDGLWAVLIRPNIRLDTSQGRNLLDEVIPLKSAVEQMANLTSVLSACYTNDLAKLSGVLQDVMIEPQRCHQIPGFASIKSAALQADALGCTISGSGPSMVAWCHAEQVTTVSDALCAALSVHCSDYQLLHSPVDAPGAKILSEEEWLGV